MDDPVIGKKRKMDDLAERIETNDNRAERKYEPAKRKEMNNV